MKSIIMAFLIILTVVFSTTLVFGEVTEYTVEPGDTLSKIAERFLGNINRYPELAKLNNISNPDLIYIGQKIKIPSIKPQRQYTPEERIEQVALFMFKVSGIPPAKKEDIENILDDYRTSLRKHGFKNLEDQRKVLSGYIKWTRTLEIWQLSEAIVKLSFSDFDLMCSLIALAWQESHFINRIGSLGEVSFYQFLPSTVRLYSGTDEIGLQNVLWELKNNPLVATSFAVFLLKEHDGNWALYNSGVAYTPNILNKINKVKKELR